MAQQALPRLDPLGRHGGERGRRAHRNRARRPPLGNRQSRKTRFEVAHAWDTLDSLFKKKRIALMMRTLAMGRGVSDRPFILEEMTEAQRRSPMQGRVFRTRQEYEDYTASLQSESTQLAGPVAEKNWNGYASLLNLRGMQTVRTEYTKKAQSFEKLASERALDSLACMDSKALQIALDLYNGKGRDDIAQGAKCSAQINGILEGFNGGGHSCEQRLLAWSKDHVDNPRNLLWRGYLMNQEDAQSSFKAAMDAAQEPGKGGGGLRATLQRPTRKVCQIQ